MTDRVESLARRVQEDPDFLAFVLADYARSEALSDAQLARRLGCDIQQLSRLRLCRRPRSDSALFQGDVLRIASAFHVNVDILTEATRRADALGALREATNDVGFLMAARDRPDDESPTEQMPEDLP